MNWGFGTRWGSLAGHPSPMGKTPVTVRDPVSRNKNKNKAKAGGT